MNQVTNLTQYKNHTDEQKAGFDFENYKYEVQALRDLDWFNASKSKGTNEERDQKVYRLKIDPDKWYYMENACGFSKDTKGSDLNENTIEFLTILKPATAEEIPKPETLEDRVKAEYGEYDVVMLEFPAEYLLYYDEDCDIHRPHIEAQSMKGFAGYVYLWPSEFNAHYEPVKYISGNYTHPIAFLLSRGKV